ncbi:MAG: DUF3866 family protein [Bacillaceae bacterium]|nr:DUF3866 family protein [Bacillaceae bacterium]
MIEWAEGKVVDILKHDKHLQEIRVEVEGKGKELAYNYPDLTGEVEPGDTVVLNVTAVRLGLGTGGRHFVSSVRKSSVETGINHPGHIMKLRYTPYQLAVLSCEEEASPYHHILRKEDSEQDLHNLLERTPVVITELHSMLPIIVTCLVHLARQDRQSLRIVYVMTDGAALPIFLSKHVARLKKWGWLHLSITTGHAFGGDLEAVNAYSGLQAARQVGRADIIVTGMGPGIVGTRTPLGTTAMELGEMVNRVNTLGGIPIVAPRISLADERIRHRGISHHTLNTLRIAACTPAVIPYPAGNPVLDHQMWQLKEHIIVKKEAVNLEELSAILATYPVEIKTMGRTLSDDPLFFQTGALAADLAYALWKHVQNKNRPVTDGERVDLENFLKSWGA